MICERKETNYDLWGAENAQAFVQIFLWFPFKPPCMNLLFAVRLFSGLIDFNSPFMFIFILRCCNNQQPYVGEMRQKGGLEKLYLVHFYNISEKNVIFFLSKKDEIDSYEKLHLIHSYNISLKRHICLLKKMK